MAEFKFLKNALGLIINSLDMLRFQQEVDAAEEPMNVNDVVTELSILITTQLQELGAKQVASLHMDYGVITNAGLQEQLGSATTLHHFAIVYNLADVSGIKEICSVVVDYRENSRELKVCVL